MALLHRQSRIVLADDHQDLLHEIRALLTRDFEILDAVSDGIALIAAVRRCKPDLVISDIQMPGLNGIESCRSIIQERLCSAAILLTMHNDAQLLRDALAAGIRGYVLKVEAGEELIPAANTVLSGSTYFSRTVRKSVG
jgi:DNA-binding NarL/FixJ family response regulator